MREAAGSSRTARRPTRPGRRDRLPADQRCPDSPRRRPVCEGLFAKALGGADVSWILGPVAGPVVGSLVRHLYAVRARRPEAALAATATTPDEATPHRGTTIVTRAGHRP
ncbi:hypothetical protein [Streptomyces beihaiensis]|uniref:Uncharacterized protein n=1 Tax=Streptomyces beihaiensis TaxID=2984495 RepID=A0ABT3TNZ7_9ACTN|nr:hypothetical protein [Streptomyces beihaiensis]MCX3058216.1 hypothetical protein [Streptomyces beihaiensis]